MHILENCRELAVRQVLNPANAGIQWGLARKADGSLVVAAAVEWALGPPPEHPSEAVYTARLITQSATGTPPNLEPWTQKITIVARPCTGKLLVGPPRRKRIVAASAVYVKRLWLCPKCEARRLKLYLPGGSSRLWACRRCWNLGYRCQLEKWTLEWELRCRRRLASKRNRGLSPPFRWKPTDPKISCGGQIATQAIRL